MNGRLAFSHEAKLHEFLVAFLDFRQQRAGRHRHDGVPGQAPPELLDNFISHALGAFGVIRPHVYVHECPVEFAGDLGAKAVHLVVMAFDADDVRAVNERVDDFALLQIRRDENVGFQSGARGLGGNRIREITSRGTGDGVKTQFARTAQRHAHDPVFE